MKRKNSPKHNYDIFFHSIIEGIVSYGDKAEMAD